MSKVLKTPALDKDTSPALDKKTYVSVFGDQQIVVEAETTEEAQKKIELKIRAINKMRDSKVEETKIEETDEAPEIEIQEVEK